MSITNFIHKIKSKTNIDKTTILFLFIIVGVGIGSFALGRLSVNHNFINELEISASGINSQKISTDQESPQDNISLINEVREKKYVASKNGKMYYPLGCSASKRIKPENEIWFSSEIEAQKSGYTKSSMCK